MVRRRIYWYGKRKDSWTGGGKERVKVDSRTLKTEKRKTKGPKKTIQEKTANLEKTREKAAGEVWGETGPLGGKTVRKRRKLRKKDGTCNQ